MTGLLAQETKALNQGPGRKPFVPILQLRTVPLFIESDTFLWISLVHVSGFTDTPGNSKQLEMAKRSYFEQCANVRGSGPGRVRSEASEAIDSARSRQKAAIVTLGGDIASPYRDYHSSWRAIPSRAATASPGGPGGHSAVSLLSREAAARRPRLVHWPSISLALPGKVVSLSENEFLILHPHKVKQPHVQDWHVQNIA